jgi:vacuolar-type H+-ATPase subunit I/STV1
MATLSVWLFIFGGAGLLAVGVFLFASERKLRKQRRDPDALRRDHQISVAQTSPLRSSTELMTTDKHLVEKISSLSSELAQTKSHVDRLTIRNKALLAEIASLSNNLVASEKTVADLQEKIGRQSRLTSEQTVATIDPGNEHERTRTDWSLNGRKWRFEIIPATAAVTIVAAVAIGFVRTSYDEYTDEAERRSMKVNVIERTGSKEVVALNSGSEDRSETARKLNPSPGVSRRTEASKPTAVVKASPRLAGTFEITRPTRVYSGPSEISLLIYNAEPGMKINVVDSHDGWLKIRSGQGRRSGFIRQESAVRIAQN